jgi:hypothetical protein
MGATIKAKTASDAAAFAKLAANIGKILPIISIKLFFIIISFILL